MICPKMADLLVLKYVVLFFRVLAITTPRTAPGSTGASEYKSPSPLHMTFPFFIPINL
jgi:hypothetical protein